MSSDMFSAGIIWVQRLRRFRHDSRDDLVEKLQAELLASVPESDRAPGQAEIQGWADSLPNDFLEHSADPLERRGWGTLTPTCASLPPSCWRPVWSAARSPPPRPK